MSLINEALKRARDVQKRPREPRIFEASLEPAVEQAAARQGLVRMLILGAAPAVVLILGCVSVFFGRSPEPKAPPSREVIRNIQEAEAPARQTVYSLAQQPALSEAATAPATQVLKAQIKAAHELEELRLQAIHYRLRDPSIVINGITLVRGGEIAGARVVSIERDRVRIVREGKVSEIRLNHSP